MAKTVVDLNVRGTHRRPWRLSPFMRLRVMPVVDTVECAHPEEPVSVGMSNAWRMRGRDNCAYIVMLRRDGDRTALNEMACACLARHFKLPMLKAFLVPLSAEHAARINARRGAGGLPPIGEGRHFGVKFTEQVML